MDVLLTLRVEADAPDEALERLYAYLAEDLGFFNETRPEKVHSEPDPDALSAEILSAIKIIIATASVIGAGTSVVQAGAAVKKVAGKLHGYLAEHRGGGIKAIHVTAETGGQAEIPAAATPAETQTALEQAVHASEETGGPEAP